MLSIQWINCRYEWFNGTYIWAMLESILEMNITIIAVVTYIKSTACHSEIIKTMFMEAISIAVFDRNIEHYLRSKDKSEKSYDVLRNIQFHMSKYRKNWRFTIHYVKPTAQLLFKSWFPKSGQINRRQVVNQIHQLPHWYRNWYVTIIKKIFQQ